MKKNSLGFTLLELIIAVSISSIISFLLFMAYYQTQKSSARLDSLVFVDNSIALIQNQIEKDISGVFAANVTPSEKPKPEKQNEKKSENEKKQKEENPKEKQPKLLDKTFFSENSGSNLKELTFITNNPMQVYGQSNPRIVRVIYNLKPSKENNQSLSLSRQESNDLEYKKTLEAQQYVMLDNIRNLTIEFIAPEIKKEEEKQQKQSADKQKQEKEKKETEAKLIKSKDWKYKNGKNENIIPKFVNVKLSLWEDKNFQTYQDFEFKYQIFAYESQFFEKDQNKKKDDVFSAIDELRRKAGIIDKSEKENQETAKKSNEKQK